MMAAKHNAAQAATRGLLTLLGPLYDEANLGLPAKALRKPNLQKALLSDFENACAYCGTELSLATIEVDHVVAMNKTSLGLHMYGNLAACCNACNRKKAMASLDSFLASFPVARAKAIKLKLEKRALDYGANVDTSELKNVVAKLSASVSDFTEKQIKLALSQAPKPGKVSKAALESIQSKATFDFSGVAKKFPLGAKVIATKDGLTGVVVDYSLEGDKGKRQPYVVFFCDQKKKKVTRSPNQLSRH